MKKALTPRQKQLLKIIYQYVNTTGYPPSFEEMKEELGVSSNQSIFDLLNHLEKKKVIKKNKSRARSITLLPLGFQLLNKANLVSFLGTSSAGLPLEAIEAVGEWQELPANNIKVNENSFVVKINGDSMINAGINDGDLAMVKKQQEFNSGDIVLARIEDGTTIKRFISKGRSEAYLKPENPKYKVIPFTEDTQMIGKVVSVFKKFNVK